MSWIDPVGFPELRERWYGLCARAGGTEGLEAAYEEIAQRYLEPHRRYHTLAHIRHCFEVCDRFAHHVLSQAEMPTVYLALLLHDSVQTGRADDPQRSAEFATTLLDVCGFPRHVVARVGDLIPYTDHERVPVNADECVLVDVDLAILGAKAERFDEYERQVRAEYPEEVVPAEVFARTRANILRRFLDTKTRPFIYRVQPLRIAYEAQARANLARSIERLDRGIVLS